MTARALATAGLLALTVGCTTPGTVPAQVPPAAPTITAPTVTAPAAAQVADPVAVAIPAIGVDADLVGLGLAPDGTAAVPDTAAQPSWYTPGVRPGEVGPAVLLGHVDYDGAPGVFARLDELDPGHLVLVDRADGSTATFEVTGTETVPKAGWDPCPVWCDTPLPVLRLVTCSGAFVGGDLGYADNTVVTAELVAEHRGAA